MNIEKKKSSSDHLFEILFEFKIVVGFVGKDLAASTLRAVN